MLCFYLFILFFNIVYYFLVCILANKGQIPNESNRQQISGILGIVNLLVGPYIIVIKEKKHIGKINGHDIWQLLETDMIPLPKTKLHLNETQVYTFIIYLFEIIII
jgi:hypothetical protein